MACILITGVAGLLGSRLADWIIGNHPNVEIVGVDNLMGGYIMNVHPKVNFYNVDVGSDQMDKIFRTYQPEIVYHFAAIAAEGLSPFIRRFNYHNNVVVTANVVNLCIKYSVKRLVFTSSMAVYGNNEAPFSENLTPQPIDPYGVAKYACEMDIRVAGEQHRLDWCIIRPHNLFGAKQNLWDSYRNFIGIAMYKCLVGDPITVYGTGLQTRAFSYIDDCLEPLWKAGIDPRASKQIINLGGTEETTIIDAANSVVEVVGSGEILYLPARHEVKHAYSTWDESVRCLDFEHRTSLKDGIAKMWEWAQQQPKRERMVWGEYEITDGLYEFWRPETLKDGYWKTQASVSQV